MQQEKKLAIIIPSYKIDFFEETLISISNQTNKNFTLYIGDDFSPYDLFSIVSKYNKLIDIVYKRFNENLGSRSLSEQWNRCIRMAEEEWIWLFSDDDLMDSNCVESFYTLISEKEPINEVLKFNTNIINSDGKIRFANRITPESFSTEDLIKFRYCNNLNFYAVEFIFLKKTFLMNNGYVHLPLGWGSDAASIFLFGRNSGFLTIPNAKVYWRWSGKNISSKNESLITIKKKLIARIYFLKFLNKNFSHEISNFRSEILKKQIDYPYRLSPSLSFATQFSFAKRILNIFNIYSSFEFYIVAVSIYKNRIKLTLISFYRKMKSLIK